MYECNKNDSTCNNSLYIKVVIKVTVRKMSSPSPKMTSLIIEASVRNSDVINLRISLFTTWRQHFLCNEAHREEPLINNIV